MTQSAASTGHTNEGCLVLDIHISSHTKHCVTEQTWRYWLRLRRCFRFHIALTLYLWLSISLALGQRCTTPTKEMQQTIVDYVARLNHTSAHDNVSLVSIARESNSCFFKITFNVRGLPAPLHVYLAPDKRHITGALFDLNKPPLQEGPDTQQLIERTLKTASGHEDAPEQPMIHLTEVVDYQCPYCRQLNR